MYRYYSVRTDCLESVWKTKDVERFFTEKNIFNSREKGHFCAQDFFCDIHLMFVKDWDSWNSDDYDCMKTNYISIVVGDEKVDEREMIMKELSVFLAAQLIEED